MFYYKTHKDDKEVIAKLQSLAELYPTRGFEDYYGKIRNEGIVWNRKRVLRIYRAIKLGLRRKHKRRLPARVKEPLQQPDKPNKSYSMDFMSDSLTSGRKLRVLKIMDDYTRESLAVYADHSICSQQVTEVLNQIITERGKPEQIRVDNGPEFTSKIFSGWCNKNEISIKYIQPGKPMQNGYIERLNRTFREDVLDAYQFETLEELRILSDEWQYTYNHYHPHKSLNRKPPVNIYNAWRHAHNKRMIEQEQQNQTSATEHSIIHLL